MGDYSTRRSLVEALCDHFDLTTTQAERLVRDLEEKTIVAVERGPAAGFMERVKTAERGWNLG